MLERSYGFPCMPFGFTGGAWFSTSLFNGFSRCFIAFANANSDLGNFSILQFFPFRTVFLKKELKTLEKI